MEAGLFWQQCICERNQQCRREGQHSCTVSGQNKSSFFRPVSLSTWLLDAVNSPVIHSHTRLVLPSRVERSTAQHKKFSSTIARWSNSGNRFQMRAIQCSHLSYVRSTVLPKPRETCSLRARAITNLTCHPAAAYSVRFEKLWKTWQIESASNGQLGAARVVKR